MGVRIEPSRSPERAGVGRVVRILGAVCIAGQLAVAGCSGNSCSTTSLFVRPAAIALPVDRPGLEAVDLYAFPSPSNPANVVLAFNVHPLIPPGFGDTTVFDPNALYQIKIDNTGDLVEDLVIQLKAS